MKAQSSAHFTLIRYVDMDEEECPICDKGRFIFMGQTPGDARLVLYCDVCYTPVNRWEAQKALYA